MKMAEIQPTDLSGEPVEPPAVIQLSTPAFSSPDPATDGLRMIPIVDEAAAQEDESVRAGDITALEEEEGVGVQSQSTDDSEKTAAQWVAEINATNSQQELDAVLERYGDTGKDYKTVDDAADAKQQAIDNA
jgi:hypothetical protein